MPVRVIGMIGVAPPAGTALHVEGRKPHRTQTVHCGHSGASISRLGRTCADLTGASLSERSINLDATLPRSIKMQRGAETVGRG